MPIADQTFLFFILIAPLSSSSPLLASSPLPHQLQHYHSRHYHHHHQHQQPIFLYLEMNEIIINQRSAYIRLISCTSDLDPSRSRLAQYGDSFVKYQIIPKQRQKQINEK